MAGGGGGAVGMRLNIMTALYLPILGYAMSTFEVNADALVISSENLEAYAVATNRIVPIGDRFEASILYELKPTEEQKAAMEAASKSGEHQVEDHSAKIMFKPEVKIDAKASVSGIYYDTVEAKFYLDTEKLRAQLGTDQSKEFEFSAEIIAHTIGGNSFQKNIKEKFTVFKPSVNVVSNSVPTLIAECENSLRFDAVGYDVSQLILFDRSSNQTINGNTITWSPRGDTTVITVSVKTPSGQIKELDKKGFRIKPTPSPIAGIRREKEKSFLALGEQVAYNEPFELVIRPDESFLKDFPKDAKYRVDEIYVEVGRRNLPPETTIMDARLLKDFYVSKKGTNEEVYLFSGRDAVGKPLNNVSSISIRIDKIFRINFQNKPIPVDVNTFKSNFSINAK